VLGALGKAQKTPGKGFVECNTWQRVQDKQLVSKELFAKCLLSGTRQRFCRVSKNTQQIIFKKNKKTDFKNSKKIFLIWGGPH